MKNMNKALGLFFSVLAATLSLVVTTKEVSAAPISGFNKSVLVSSGLSIPTEMAFAPDNRLFILEQAGKIKIYKNGSLLTIPFGSVPAFASSDRGALGLAFDPNWATEPMLYVYFIDKTDGFHKIWKINASADTSTGNWTEIYSSKIVAGSNHAGGSLHFDENGKLFVGIGDSGGAHEAQSLSRPLGKILRINKDGTIPSDNPFFGQTGKEQRIWAYGLRNPFRFQFDGHHLYLGDVGNVDWEEINIIEKGKNYGWPTVEGKCKTNCANFTDPIYAYKHIPFNAAGDTTGAVIGGFVYRGNLFPKEYQGRYFFADFSQGQLRYLNLTEDGHSVIGEQINFDPSIKDIVEIVEAPDGSIYSLILTQGQLIRYAPNQTNKPPVVKISSDKTTGPEPLLVKFSSLGSNDPEGKTLTYKWNFGDGGTSTEANPSHTYPDKGRFNVSLQVSDGVNSVTSENLVIQVSTPPILNIVLPLSNTLYTAGETIQYKAEARDSDGNNIPVSNFTTEIRFHHNVHYHPFMPEIVGNAGTFKIPTTGETAADVWYKIIVTVKDSNGLTTTKELDVHPKRSTTTLTTSPAGLTILLDGQPITAPHSFLGVAGIERNLEAKTQDLNGKTYEFVSWSNGKSAEHVFSTPETNTTLTAVFKEKKPQVPTETFTINYWNFPKSDANTKPVFPNTPPVYEDSRSFIDFSWDKDSSPSPKIGKDYFLVEATGAENFDDGIYTFRTLSDDGIRVYIDGQLKIDQWNDHGTTSHSVDVQMNKGVHSVKVEFYERTVSARLKLDITKKVFPNIWNTLCFNGINLQGPAILNRTDAAVNFVWNASSPDPSVPLDNFSCRFTKSNYYSKGTYNFRATADDGVRVYIDGELVLNQWKDQPSTTFNFQKTLTAGVHEIKIEYFESFGGAVIKFLEL